MATQPSPIGRIPATVSLLAIPEAAVSTLFGIFDVMNAFALMRLSPRAPRRFTSRSSAIRSARWAGQWRAGQGATGDRHYRN